MQKTLSITLLILLAGGCAEKKEDIRLTQSAKISVNNILFNNYFETGDIIGIYPVGYRNGQPGIPGDIAYPINVPFVFQGNEWKPQGEEYFFTSENKLDLYAYYPYDPELGSKEGKLNMAEYEMDLSGQQSGKAVDLLWAKNTADANKSNIANLEFNRLFSKITIRLNLVNSNPQHSRIEIHNLFTSPTVNLREGNIVSNKDKNIIHATPVTGQTGNPLVFEAIISPQTIEEGTPLFLLFTDQQTGLYTADQSIELRAGMNYTFHLTVDITFDSESGY